MVTRIVHIGDVHLQSTHPRNDARLRSLDQIINEGLRLERLGAWLIPGDVFHQRSTIDDRNAFAARLQKMAAVAPVALTVGNHDLPGDLDIFARLKAKWPVVVQTLPGVLDLQLATGDIAAIATLPYPTRSGLASMGVAKGDVVRTAAELLDAIFMSFAGELATARVGGALPLFMGHVNVAGSIASTGQPQIGVEIEIDRAMLQRLPVVYAALNHIHRPQDVGLGTYAGSIARFDFGEIEDKSYVVVTAERDASGWTATKERRPIDVAPMFHVDGTLTRDGFAWQVTAGPGGAVQPAPASWRGAEVRVRYRYQASEKGILNKARVLAEFAEAGRLEIEPIAVPDRQLRAPAVAAARTLADKVKAYAETSGTAVPETLMAKLALLEHRDPLVLLSTIQTELTAIEQGEKETVAA